jgi:hypothetical protein
MNIADTSTFPPAASLIARNEAGESLRAIAKSLHCSVTKLTTYMRGYVYEVPSASLDKKSQRRRAIVANDKFVRLMQTAINQGLECTGGTKMNFTIDRESDSIAARS